MISQRAMSARYAAAKTEAEAASAAVERASKERLEVLKRAAPSEQFRAFESDDGQLTPEHRRALLKHLRETPAKTVSVAATTATRLEIWRSRLPYRAVPIAVTGLAIGMAAVLFFLASRNTPRRAVQIANAEDLVGVTWTGPDGRRLFDDRLIAGRRYGLVNEDDGGAILRDWRPGHGYAVANIPKTYLVPAR